MLDWLRSTDDEMAQTCTVSRLGLLVLALAAGVWGYGTFNGKFQFSDIGRMNVKICSDIDDLLTKSHSAEPFTMWER